MKSQLVRTLMVGISEIAECSGVGKQRVREWIRTGAPIWRDSVSGRWLAEQDTLWEWRKQRLVKGGYSAKSKSGDD